MVWSLGSCLPHQEGEEKEPECRGIEVQGAGLCRAAPKSLSSFGELLAISEGLPGLVGEGRISRVSPQVLSAFQIFRVCQLPILLELPFKPSRLSQIQPERAGRTAPTAALPSSIVYHGIPPKYISPPNTRTLTSTKQVTFKNKHS